MRKPINWSDEELRWIKKHRTMERAKAHAKFCEQFRTVNLGAYISLCKRNKWLTGRDGRLKPGNIPPNKGKKVPYNANSARTQFKKGERRGVANHVYKPIGHERVTPDGYVERKIHNGLPMQSRWRAVHLINWEAIHGPLPKDHCLKCKSENRADTNPSNWELIPRGVLPFLNGHRGHHYKQVSDEAKPVVITLAKLRFAAGAAKLKRKKEAHEYQ